MLSKLFSVECLYVLHMKKIFKIIYIMIRGFFKKNLLF